MAPFIIKMSLRAGEGFPIWNSLYMQRLLSPRRDSYFSLPVRHIWPVGAGLLPASDSTHLYITPISLV